MESLPEREDFSSVWETVLKMDSDVTFDPSYFYGTIACYLMSYVFDIDSCSIVVGRKLAAVSGGVLLSFLQRHVLAKR